MVSKCISNFVLCGIIIVDNRKGSGKRLEKIVRNGLNMEIRKARKDDLNGIEQLLVQVNNLHVELRPDIFVANAVKYDEEKFDALISSDKTPVFVAVDDEGKVIGHLFCSIRDYKQVAVYKDFKTLFIDDLCVDETTRGQGVGKALYEFAIGYAREKGCYDVTLNVWEGNKSARAFYEKMGMFPKETQMEYIL